MNSLEDYLRKATEPGPGRRLPGAVLVVANKDGITYSSCFGTHSVDSASPLSTKPLSLDTPMWTASCTKLMTAIAALQCVERGQLALDDDISAVLPEFKEPEIVVGVEETTKKPILEKAGGHITLRMLLTHQSGLGYRFLNPEYDRYAEYHKLPSSGTVPDKYPFPLLFEPGTSWTYGVGVDWAGKMVERVNGNQSLGSYMRRHIWEPLGMSATTFRPETLPGLEERVAEMTMRGPDGGLTPGRTQDIRGSCLDDEGGGGAYSSPRDYTTLLVSLLKNDGTLLEPASVEVLLSPGLTDAAAKALKAIISTRFTTADAAGEVDSTLTGGVIAPSEVDYAPGGMVALADVPGGRKAGSVSWGGLPNLSWVLDRATGTALFYASQLMPTGDKDTRDVFKKFEAVVYAESS